MAQDKKTLTPYYEDDSVTLYHGDCLDLLPKIDGKFEVLLTDPPYFKVKQDEWDNQWAKSGEFLEWMGDWLDLTKPLLADRASVWVFASPAMTSSVERVVGERFKVLNSIRWMKQAGWHQKANVGAARRFLTPWEGLIFAEQYADEWAALDYENRKRVFVAVGRHIAAAREGAGMTRSEVAPALLGLYSNLDTAKAMLSDWEIGKKYITPEAHEVLAGLYGAKLRPYTALRREYEDLRREYEDLRREYEDLRRTFNAPNRQLLMDVWDFKTVPPYPGKHPAEKPLPLLEHMITTGSRAGDLILDPFAGSGSTLEAARTLGRKAVGIEKDEAYCEKIAERLARKELSNA